MTSFIALRPAVRKFQIVVGFTLLTLGLPLLMGRFVELVHADPAIKKCTGNARVKGNACGPTVECAAPNCVSWFTAADGTFYRCVDGLATDNCISSTGDENLVVCGSGGQCDLRINDECVALAGTTKFTPKVNDGPPCFTETGPTNP